MTLKKINPTKTKSWKKLKTHFKEIENEEIKNLLSSRPSNKDFNLKWNDFNVDISKLEMKKGAIKHFISHFIS